MKHGPSQTAIRENPEALRRLVAGWQLVDERDREERRREEPDASASIRAALELMDLFGEIHGWPPPENDARRRDDELARERWVRVRNHYATHGEAAQSEAP